MNFNNAVDGRLDQVWNLRMEEKKRLRRTPSSDLLGTPSTASLTTISQPKTPSSPCPRFPLTCPPLPIDNKHSLPPPKWPPGPRLHQHRLHLHFGHLRHHESRADGVRVVVVDILVKFLRPAPALSGLLSQGARTPTSSCARPLAVYTWVPTYAAPQFVSGHFLEVKVANAPPSTVKVSAASATQGIILLKRSPEKAGLIIEETRVTRKLQPQVPCNPYKATRPAKKSEPQDRWRTYFRSNCTNSVELIAIRSEGS